MMKTLSLGFSAAAEFLNGKYEDALERFHGTVTFSKQVSYDELAEVYNDCSAPNWDAAGADAVEPDTFHNAYLFIKALPWGYPLPSVGAEPDGHVTLEWYRAPNWLLSVSVSREGTLYWAALVGMEDPRGSCPFYGEVPDSILYWIRRVCAD
jgi:hypothetical protein